MKPVKLLTVVLLAKQNFDTVWECFFCEHSDVAHEVLLFKPIHQRPFVSGAHLSFQAANLRASMAMTGCQRELGTRTRTVNSLQLPTNIRLVISHRKSLLAWKIGTRCLG